MALFKILQGSAEGLKNLKATEGYAYFTPDDGKFYIDIESTDTAAEVVVGETSAEGVSRICINSGKSGGSSTVIIDTGMGSEATIIYNCEIPAGTLDEDIVRIECNPQ